MKLAILLVSCAFVFGQNTSPTSETKATAPDEKPQNRDFGLGTGIQGKHFGAVDILSDTQGVDFGQYLQRILQDVRRNWYILIPPSAEMKKGKLAIEFAIMKDGQVARMRLVATSGDVVLDRAAWGGITASNHFPPLPSDFTGPYLALRVRFYYNPDRSDLDQNPILRETQTLQQPSKSGIAVSISPLFFLQDSVACHGNSDTLGCITPPRQAYAPEPKYPESERKAGHQGTVTLMLVVGSDGVPHDIRVAQTLSPDLDQATVDAVKEWKFTPAIKDGKPTPVQIAIKVGFHLY